MIQKINYFITRVFDIILYPFSFIADFWGILFLSIVMSFVVLWIYKKVSSPKSVRAAKDQIKANILAIRLYKDSGKVIGLSFFKSLLYTFKYFGLNLLPLVFIIPLLFPVFVRMDLRYGVRPFKVGEEIVVKAKFNPDIQGMEIGLMESENFKPGMKPVFIKALKEVNWKLEAIKPGAVDIRVKVGEKVYEKSLWIGVFRGSISDKKMKKSSLDHFLNPVEKLFPPGEVENIIVKHPGKSITFAGVAAHWLVFNIILVLIVVLAFKNKFGIEF